MRIILARIACLGALALDLWLDANYGWSIGRTIFNFAIGAD